MARSPLGVSQKSDTIAHIQGQAEDHRKRNFEEEFLAFLKKNGVEYDPKHVWGQVQASLRDANRSTLPRR